MRSSDAPRRLRLVTAQPRAHVEPFATRVPAPGRCVAIADASPDAGALDFALWLLEALSAPAPVLFLSFHGAPELPEGARDRLTRSSSARALHTVQPDAGALREVLSGFAQHTQGLWLCVGEPAIALLDAPVSVLVGIDAPPTAWLPSLRPWQAQVTLGLTLARRPVAESLAALLTSQV